MWCFYVSFNDISIFSSHCKEIYTSVKFRGSKLQQKILKKQNLANFAINRLQNCSFCKLLNYKRFNETAENSTNKFYIYNEVA